MQVQFVLSYNESRKKTPQVFIKMLLFSFGLRLRKYHMSMLKNFLKFEERFMRIIEGILVISHYVLLQ